MCRVCDISPVELSSNDCSSVDSCLAGSFLLMAFWNIKNNSTLSDLSIPRRFQLQNKIRWFKYIFTLNTYILNVFFCLLYSLKNNIIDYCIWVNNGCGGGARLNEAQKELMYLFTETFLQIKIFKFYIPLLVRITVFILIDKPWFPWSMAS